MNVAAIAIALPVSLVSPNTWGWPPRHPVRLPGDCGMPFNLLIGAAPNAIAYESKQFTTGEFSATAGYPAWCSWPS